jgi:hypothetical protein
VTCDGNLSLSDPSTTYASLLLEAPTPRFFFSPSSASILLHRQLIVASLINAPNKDIIKNAKSINRNCAMYSALIAYAEVDFQLLSTLQQSAGMADTFV